MGKRRSAMEMEMISNCLPTYYSLVFDDANKLGGDDHKNAFNFAFHRFAESLKTAVDPGIFLQLPIIDREFGENEWIALSELLLDLNSFSERLYYLADFEYTMKAKLNNSVYYKIIVNTDPIVFRVEKINK